MFFSEKFKIYFFENFFKGKNWKKLGIKFLNYTVTIQ